MTILLCLLKSILAVCVTCAAVVVGLIWNAYRREQYATHLEPQDLKD